MKILVAAGGLSPERDVSLASGALIANALLDNGHQVALADIYSAVPCSGDGTPSADLFFRKDSGKRFSYTIAQQQPDIEALIRANGGRRDQVGPGFLALCRQADIVFVALHGGIGENGGFQALMETFGIRHTGSGSEGCALSMDKSIAKILAAAAGIQTPPAVFLPTELSAGEAAARAAQETGFPCVIKPCGCGSSIGVSVVKNEAEALQAVSRARIYGTACLAEKKIEGREFSCGVLEDEPAPDGKRRIKGLPPVEILPKSGFYGYAEKYQAGFTQEICPADLSAAETTRIQEIAVAAHQALRLKVYSRSDFILDSSGVFWWLEVNTLPGMTPTSLVPQEAAAAGTGYHALCETILRVSLAIRET